MKSGKISLYVPSCAVVMCRKYTDTVHAPSSTQFGLFDLLLYICVLQDWDEQMLFAQDLQKMGTYLRVVCVMHVALRIKSSIFSGFLQQQQPPPGELLRDRFVDSLNKEPLSPPPFNAFSSSILSPLSSPPNLPAAFFSSSIRDDDEENDKLSNGIFPKLK